MKYNNQLHLVSIVTLVVYSLIAFISPVKASSQPFYSSPALKTNTVISSPELIGDAEICMVLGSTIGIYSAGGEDGDVYDWKITNSNGEEIYNRSGGSQYETIKVLFSEIGQYTVFLSVRRGTNSDFYQNLMNVNVQEGPQLALLPDYLLCGDSPVTLTALDSNTPNLENYIIRWKDINGVEVGTGNIFTTDLAGIYLVELYLENPGGSQTCVINGSTFVGPAIDFQLTKSSSVLCEGGSISLATDTPLSGEWFVSKLPNGNKVSLGNAFGVTIPSSELDGPGYYEVTFSVSSDDFVDCPSERKTSFEITQAPQVDIQILNNPDACYIQNGSFQVRATSTLTSIAIPELNFYEENIVQGQVFTFENLKAKIYLVELVRNGCTINELVRLDYDDSSSTTLPDMTISHIDETCVSEQVVLGKVTLDLKMAVTNGEYRVLSSSKGVVKSGAIPSDGKFDIALSSGQYIIEFTIGECVYPPVSVTILDQPQIDISVPSKITICESFYLVPESEDELIYTLIAPSGAVETSTTGGGFDLTESGKYSLFAEAADTNSTSCGKKIEITTTLLDSFTFTPTLVEEGCFEPIRYRAVLEGISIGKVNIRWLNSEGVIVGRGQEFYPPSTGIFSLVILPIGSGFCPIDPVEFEVVNPVTNVSMDLEFSESCSDPNAAIVSLVTNADEVVQTEWIFYDESDNRSELPQFDNLFEIVIETSGTYEVVGYNKLGCEIGRNFTYFEVAPVNYVPDLDETYPVCSRENGIESIDPGEYAAYEWYFEERLVSTAREHKPTYIGEYRLIVTTAKGCEFEKSFITYDVCNYQVVYPNAMVLGDPARDFSITISEGISEVEIFILDRQGELIYHDYSDDIPVEKPILNWNGKSNGRFVPTGNYVIRVILRNSLYSFEEKETGSLLILN